MEDTSGIFQHQFELKVDFGSYDWARIAANTLEVDKELKPNEIRKELRASDNFLHVTFRAKDLKTLRTSLTSFFDMLDLVTKTINEFGESS